MNKKALITAATSQDGAYLAGFLLNKGYEDSWNKASSFTGIRLLPEDLGKAESEIDAEGHLYECASQVNIDTNSVGMIA